MEKDEFPTWENRQQYVDKIHAGMAEKLPATPLAEVDTRVSSFRSRMRELANADLKDQLFERYWSHPDRVIGFLELAGDFETLMTLGEMFTRGELEGQTRDGRQLDDLALDIQAFTAAKRTLIRLAKGEF